MMFKTSMPLALIVLLLTSCSSFNSLFDTKSERMANMAENAVQRTTVLSTTDVSKVEKRINTSETRIAKAPEAAPATRGVIPTSLSNMASTALETFLPMQFKYAIMMNATVEKLTNVSLYKTVDDWFGTKYRYGGTTRRGIDCSAFMQVVSQYVFGWILPRTAHEQYAVMEKVAREDVQEGDFVYFHTRGRGVSHVGMCLQNNKFVHASTSKGVMISDLDDNYWDKKIIGFKRMKDGETN